MTAFLPCPRSASETDGKPFGPNFQGSNCVILFLGENFTMWSDVLTTREAEYTGRAIESLRQLEWARPLIHRVEEAGGLVPEAMPLLFEARFAYELHQAGIAPQYEYRAGVGGSTVEFRISGSRDWLIELVSIRASDAAKAAIRRTGLVYQQMLSTDAPDRSQSEEAEMITAQQKIGEKVFADGQPTKFPPPDGSAIHAIMVDMRGYLDEGGDVFDYRQIAFGAAGIPPSHRELVHYWEPEPGRRIPIAGLFEESCPLRASQLIRERIHFIGFVRELMYTEGEIQNTAYYPANPHLLNSEPEAERAFETFPLRPDNDDP